MLVKGMTTELENFFKIREECKKLVSEGVAQTGVKEGDIIRVRDAEGEREAKVSQVTPRDIYVKDWITAVHQYNLDGVWTRHLSPVKRDV